VGEPMAPPLIREVKNHINGSINAIIDASPEGAVSPNNG